MKKVLLFSMIVLASFTMANAQDGDRKLGVGLQSSFPSFGLSVKYAITDQSVVQATVAPFGSGTWKMNFFSGRYLHRWLDAASLGSNSSIDPYVFAGLGLVTYKWNGMGGNDKDSFISYGFGGGAEFVLGSKFGIALELGLGKFGISAGEGVFGITGGLGLHYYIK